jgi:hypothetical protein
MGGAQPEQGGTDSRWRVPLAGATLATFATALLTLDLAPAQPATASLPDQAAALAERLERETADAVALAGTVRARLRSGDATNWKDFDGLVAGAPTHSPVQTLVAWAPRVSATAREAFEAESGRDGFRSFRIAAPNDSGGLRPVAVGSSDGSSNGVSDGSQVHHPIAMTAPLSLGGDLLGLDLGTLSGFDAALARLESGDDVALIGPTTLLPSNACPAHDGRPGCAPSLFVIVSATEAGRPGYVVIALSWPEIALSATMGPARRYAALPERRSARATFHVDDQPWSIELRRPLGNANTRASLDVLFDRVAQTSR